MNPQDGARAAAVAIIEKITIGDPEVWLAAGSSDREELVLLIADAITQAGKEKEKEILALAAQVADEKDESIRVLVEDREKWFNRCEFELAPQSAKQAEEIAGLKHTLALWDQECGGRSPRELVEEIALLKQQKAEGEESMVIVGRTVSSMAEEIAFWKANDVARIEEIARLTELVKLDAGTIRLREEEIARLNTEMDSYATQNHKQHERIQELNEDIARLRAELEVTKIVLKESGRLRAEADLRVEAAVAAERAEVERLREALQLIHGLPVFTHHARAYDIAAAALRAPEEVS